MCVYLCVGRTDFYNDVGVIRDVMQNHMTEMLTLIASDLPADSGNISSLIESKLRVLRSLEMAGRGAVLTGQYTTYNKERLMSEQRQLNDSSLPMRNVSHTPTFAAVVLNVDNDRWRSVPFVLISGKKLDEKTSYIRLRFRSSRFCLRGEVVASDTDWCSQRQQIVFRVGDSSSRRSLIAVSKGLPTPKGHLPGWSVDRENKGALFGQNAADLISYVAEAESDPYAELIEAVMTGSRHMFVSTSSLLASWKVWTDVLKEARNVEPRLYMGRGKDAERLDLLVAAPESIPALRYWVSEVNLPHYDAELTSNEVNRQIPGAFRNSTLVSGTEQQIVEQLTREILRLATDKVSDKNNKFNLALSGGRTPVMLFHRLASAPMPWQHVHVWMVDERCDGSNFETLERHLVSRVSGLPHQNIHPMLVTYSDNPCDTNAAYRSDQLYEAAIRQHVPDSAFDFIVLGVGTDGHTASLFPGQRSVEERDSLVTLAETGVKSQQPRITLTLAAVNKAKHVAILVAGHEKNDILRRINEKSDSDYKQYPITGVRVTNGSLSWFVDNDALFGRNSR